MFNVTGGELVIILFLALMVLGPQRLPQAARTLGKVMAQIRDVSSGFQRELKDAFDEVKDFDDKPVSRPLLTAISGGAGDEDGPDNQVGAGTGADRGSDAPSADAPPMEPGVPDDVAHGAAPLVPSVPYAPLADGSPGFEPAAPAAPVAAGGDGLPEADGTRGP